MTATRPHTFDARVMSYHPGLSNLARKYKRTAEERYDLVTDTIAYALEKWENFREDGGMYNWLAWNMRGLASNQRATASRRPTFVYKGQEQGAVSQPQQEGYSDLSSVLRALSSGRPGTILLRRAMGDGLAEIADEYGVSRQRIQQIEIQERALVRRRCGLKVAA